MKTIETERLILRKFKITDAEDMYNNWGKIKDCNKYLPWKTHENIEETKDIINKWIEDYNEQKPDKLNWAIELKTTNEVIGAIGPVNISYNNKNIEIGYCIGKKFWNNGYATEALKALIKYYLLECDFHLIKCGYMSENIASGRVMEKSGMKKEAVLRERAINQYTKKYDNLVIYSILKEEII